MSTELKRSYAMSARTAEARRMAAYGETKCWVSDLEQAWTNLERDLSFAKPRDRLRQNEVDASLGRPSDLFLKHRTHLFGDDGVADPRTRVTQARTPRLGLAPQRRSR